MNKKSISEKMPKQFGEVLDGAMSSSANLAGKVKSMAGSAAVGAWKPIKSATGKMTERVLGSGRQIARNPHYAVRKSSYGYDDLIACGEGLLFGKGNPQLPLPNMLMFDRITTIDETGGTGKGQVIAELDVKPDLWFFGCHFRGDPVMPGCLGLDALWQLLGFYLGWMGGLGQGRALGLGELKFSGEVLPTAKKVSYRVDIKRLLLNRLTMGVGDGYLSVDGKEVYVAQDLKVALKTPEQSAEKSSI